MEKIADVKGFAGVDGVVLGVDTHLDVHVAVALDQLGSGLTLVGVVDEPQFTSIGHQDLVPTLLEHPACPR